MKKFRIINIEKNFNQLEILSIKTDYTTIFIKYLLELLISPCYHLLSYKQIKIQSYHKI